MICFVITPHTGHSWASCLHWFYHSVSPPKEPHNIDLLHICATDPLFTRWHAVQKSHHVLLLLSSGQSRSSQLISQQQKQNHFEDIPIPKVLAMWLTTMTRVPVSQGAALLFTHTNLYTGYTKGNIHHMLCGAQTRITNARHTPQGEGVRVNANESSLETSGSG